MAEYILPETGEESSGEYGGLIFTHAAVDTGLSFQQ